MSADGGTLLGGTVVPDHPAWPAMVAACASRDMPAARWARDVTVHDAIALSAGAFADVRKPFVWVLYAHGSHLASADGGGQVLYNHMVRERAMYAKAAWYGWDGRALRAFESAEHALDWERELCDAR